MATVTNPEVVEGGQAFIPETLLDEMRVRLPHVPCKTVYV